MTTFKNRCFVFLLAFTLFLCSCSTSRQERSLRTVLPATQGAEIIFSESQVPVSCEVFAHLLISIPTGLSGVSIKNQVQQFAMSNGADYVLVGMTRESKEDDLESITFTPYGPQTPYSFNKRWAGWKFGFSDWNNGRSLVDYGYDHSDDARNLFHTPVITQAVLLTCPSQN